MSFRTRLLLASMVAVLVPLIVFAFGVRKEMRGRLTAQYERRVTSLVSVIEEDLAQQSEAIAGRLATLKSSVVEDNRFRSAALDRVASERSYLLDYAREAMRLSGLSMLQIQDDGGRILSSGHFRNDYDRLEPGLPKALAASPGGIALAQARTAETTFLVLARADSIRLADRWFTVVGGVSVDRRFLARLARGQDLAVTLLYPGGAFSSAPELSERLARDRSASAALEEEGPQVATAFSDLVVGELTLPYVEAGEVNGAGPLEARIVVTHPLTPLIALRRSIDVWFLLALAVTGIAALLAASWFSSKISRPLTELAHKTAQVDLDRLDVDFESDRDDEVGALSRLLGAMTKRLRASAGKLREAERRATLGDVARQVNHDIKNGLIPIRNVFRHFSQVVRDEPQMLSTVFDERQGTIDSSISYLENLAANYARLSSQSDRRPCDLNGVIRQVVADARGGGQIDLRVRLAEGLPAVLSDPLVLRRILENLIGNAIDSLESQPGTVTISTESVDGAPERPRIRLTVADTGPGMNDEQLERIFDDFYTTKEGGTGLGLSIVRRLVLDLNGKVQVESQSGKGTRFVVELPTDSLHSTPEPTRAESREGARP